MILLFNSILLLFGFAMSMKKNTLMQIISLLSYFLAIVFYFYFDILEMGVIYLFLAIFFRNVINSIIIADIYKLRDNKIYKFILIIPIIVIFISIISYFLNNSKIAAILFILALFIGIYINHFSIKYLKNINENNLHKLSYIISVIGFLIAIIIVFYLKNNFEKISILSISLSLSIKTYINYINLTQKSS